MPNSYGRFFTDRTIISKPLNSDIPQEKREIKMSWQRDILDKVKEYIDTNLYSAKANIIDPHKKNYQLPPTIDCILSDLSITSKDCYNALSISKDSSYELHLIMAPNFCFVNDYFEEGLMAWQANMDIQLVFNE